MQAHFSTFTPDAMRAFGQELATQYQQRREILKKTTEQTAAFLADFRRTHRQAEVERQGHARREADGRRLFVSELRSGVHALRNRFELARGEIAAGLRQMASELRAASEAFRNRPGRQAGFAFRSGGRPITQPPPPAHRNPAVGAGQERTNRNVTRHAKKRHG